MGAGKNYENGDDSDNPYAYGRNSHPEDVPLRLLPTFVDMARSDEPGAAFHGVLMIRKFLSLDRDLPIQAVVDTGVVPLLVKYLACDDWPEMQFEAAWAVTNISGGDAQEHTYMLIRLGAMPHLVRLLESDNEELREQASWAVANIAAESADCRDFALSLGAMTPLLNGIKMPYSKISVLRNAVWALANLCSPKLPPATECFVPVLPTLTAALKHRDREVVSNACWAISNICDGPIEHVHHVVQTGALDTVVELLNSITVSVQTPALRTISHILKARDNAVDFQTVIDGYALRSLLVPLRSNHDTLQWEACRCLSTICGTPDHIQAVIAAGLHVGIFELMNASESYVSQEALRCIAKSTAGGTEPQLRYLIEKGVIAPLCRALKKHVENNDFLDSHDDDDDHDSLTAAALQSVQKLLTLDREGPNGSQELSSVARAFVDNGGVDVMEALLTHSSPEVRDLAKCLLMALAEPVDAVS